MRLTSPRRGTVRNEGAHVGGVSKRRNPVVIVRMGHLIVRQKFPTRCRLSPAVARSCEGRCFSFTDSGTVIGAIVACRTTPSRMKDRPRYGQSSSTVRSLPTETDPFLSVPE